MKLVRFGPRGQEKPGLVDRAGRVRDISAKIPDWSDDALTPAALQALKALDLEALPLAPEGARFGCPVGRIGKYIAIGLNYADHAAESNMPIPQEPVVFMKATSCIGGANDPIMAPQDATKLDWEAELCVVIGTTARYVEESAALNYVAGYCVANDVSERAFQLERGGQWDKGKGCDTFGPVGPWLVTADEAGDPQGLGVWLDVNGVRKQTGNTRTMIFPVAKLICYLSRFMTLAPGDLITTGTPPGVGMGQKPPLFLKPGDEVRLGIDKLGEQRQRVIEWRAGGPP